MKIKPKIIKKRKEKACSICGKHMKVIIYTDRSYRGGHYFGKIPLVSKAEMAKALKLGTKKEKFGDLSMQIMKKDPKAYGSFEYWECPKCYWK
ncbi:MAG: hypothetical protein AAB629_02825 [Patescibacteria group bacterium]